MRLRSVLALALGSGALVLAAPAVASAATGTFSYQYTDSDGFRLENVLFDPPSRACITLQEAADPADTAPADSPRNRTDAVATAFTGPDCTGDQFSMRPFTGYGSERLKLRSVLFS